MKNFKFILVAAAAALLMGACSSDNNGTAPADGEMSVGLIINSGEFQGVRGDYATVPTTYSTAINSATIFFLDGNDKVLAVKTLDDADAASDIPGNEYLFTKLSDLTRSVLVAINIPSSATIPGAGKSLSDVNGLVMGIATQNPVATSSEPVGLENILMSSSSTSISYVAGTTEYTVPVSVTPAVARLEFDKIAPKDDKSQITSFTVANVYVENYYPNFTLAGASNGTLLEMGISSDKTAAEIDAILGAWAMKDASGLEIDGTTKEFDGDVEYSLNTTAGNIFGYQIAAGAAPRIILELTDVLIERSNQTPQTEDRMFVTVTGFTTTSGPLTTFTKGNVYKVTNITFDEDDITTTPDPVLIKVTVNVTVTPWVINTIDPVV